MKNCKYCSTQKDGCLSPRREIRSSPQAPSIREYTQLFFSDNAIIPSSLDRFIGQGESAPVTISLEEAFLSSAVVIDSPVVVSRMTVALKRPSESFKDVTFELIRVSSSDKVIKLTSESTLAFLRIPGEIVTDLHSVYTQTIKFSVTLLNEGDLIGVRVEPSGETCKFSVSATIS